jgi:methyl-accepting chemotaxis protein
VNQSGQSLQEIVGSVKRVTDIVAEIAAASQEQATGIEQVSKAVAQMDQVTQANAAQTEELSSTAQTLTAQAEQLQAVVARFKLRLKEDMQAIVGSDSAPQTRAAKTRMKAVTAHVLPRKAKPAPIGAHAEAEATMLAERVPGRFAQPNGSTHGLENGFEEF